MHFLPVTLNTFLLYYQRQGTEHSKECPRKDKTLLNACPQSLTRVDGTCAFHSTLLLPKITGAKISPSLKVATTLEPFTHKNLPELLGHLHTVFPQLIKYQKTEGYRSQDCVKP